MIQRVHMYVCTITHITEKYGKKKKKEKKVERMLLHIIIILSRIPSRFPSYLEYIEINVHHLCRWTGQWSFPPWPFRISRRTCTCFRWCCRASFLLFVCLLEGKKNDCRIQLSVDSKQQKQKIGRVMIITSHVVQTDHERRKHTKFLNLMVVLAAPRACFMMEKLMTLWGSPLISTVRPFLMSDVSTDTMESAYAFLTDAGGTKATAVEIKAAKSKKMDRIMMDSTNVVVWSKRQRVVQERGVQTRETMT